MPSPQESGKTLLTHDASPEIKENYRIGHNFDYLIEFYLGLFQEDLKEVLRENPDFRENA